MQQELRKYFLCLREGKNTFITVDWRQSKFYRGENLNDLKVIDSFTSKATSLDILKDLLIKGLIEVHDNFMGFDIVYIEDDKYKIIEEGPIFKEDEHILSEDELIEYIISRRYNKQTISFINDQIEESNNKLLQTFKHVLETIKYYLEEPDTLRERLNIFKYLDYETKRKICVKISENMYEERMSSSI